MTDQPNTLRHAENVIPVLRGIWIGQRPVLVAELVPGSGTWTRNGKHLLALVQDTGSAREVWR